jgi:hypothetical protein
MLGENKEGHSNEEGMLGENYLTDDGSFIF